MYSLPQFCNMWENAEISMKRTTEQIEMGERYRTSDLHTRFDYGLVPPDTAQVRIFGKGSSILMKNYRKLHIHCLQLQCLFSDVLMLDKSDIFVDFGHGLGNLCLQAAYTIGCEARGVEIVPERHFFAEKFSHSLKQQNQFMRDVFSVVSVILIFVFRSPWWVVCPTAACHVTLTLFCCADPPCWKRSPPVWTDPGPKPP